jgi:hypothetical protein
MFVDRASLQQHAPRYFLVQLAVPPVPLLPGLTLALPVHGLIQGVPRPRLLDFRNSAIVSHGLRGPEETGLKPEK